MELAMQLARAAALVLAFGFAQVRVTHAHLSDTQPVASAPNYKAAAECLGAFYERGGFSTPNGADHVVVASPPLEEYESNRGVNRIRLLARDQHWSSDELTQAAAIINYQQWKGLIKEYDPARKYTLFQALVDETLRCERLLDLWGVPDSMGDRLIPSS